MPRVRSRPQAKPAGRRMGERGQGLVEFALVLPVFLILILATVDFGWALRAYIVTTNAAREGARIAAIGESEAIIKAKAVTASSGLLTTSNVTVTGAKGAAGAPVTVSVTYNYSYITPLGGILSGLTGGSLPSPLPVKAAATMRME